MKALIAILVVLIVGVGGWKLWEYWQMVEQQREASEKNTGPPPVDPARLAGLPPKLEPELQSAYKAGAAGLKSWLDKFRKSPFVKDPRLGWIELDYMLLVAQSNPVEAKKIYISVKNRTTPDSPIYPRIKSLEKTYE